MGHPQSRAWSTAKVTAHHAIIPTGVMPQEPLDDGQANVFSLICLGYARQFFKPLRFEAQQVLVELPSETGAETPTRIWKAHGRRILEPGWTILEKDVEDSSEEGPEKDVVENQAFPEMREDDVCTCTQAEAKARKTKAPPLFTEGTLITAMANVHTFITDQAAKKILRENEGIGTEATRAGVLETLKKRAYITVRKNKIHITALGENALNLSPDALKDPVTTAIWERQLKDIAEGRLYLDKFIHEQEKAIPAILEGIFSTDLESFKVDVHKCPACGEPLRRFQSRKDKKTYYWACLRKEQHPDEKPVFLPDDKGKPGQRQGQTEAETAACPDCGAQMRRLQSKKNKKAFYWACSKGRENGCPLRSDDNGKVGEAFS
jgi:DNA topoisomerase III